MPDTPANPDDQKPLMMPRGKGNPEKPGIEPKIKLELGSRPAQTPPQHPSPFKAGKLSIPSQSASKKSSYQKPTPEFHDSAAQEAIPHSPRSRRRKERTIQLLIGKLPPVWIYGVAVLALMSAAGVFLLSRLASGPAEADPVVVKPVPMDAGTTVAPATPAWTNSVPSAVVEEKVSPYLKRFSEAEKSGDSGEIESIFRNAAREQTTMPQFWVVMGTAYHRYLAGQGDLEIREIRARADVFFERALRFGPQFPNVLSLCGAYFLETGQVAEALEALTALATLRPLDTGILGQLAFTQVALGKESEALHTVQQMVALDPEDPRFRLAHAELLGDLQRFEEASEAYRVYAALAPEDIDTIQKHAVLLRDHLGRPEAAKALVDRTLLQFPMHLPLAVMQAALLVDLADHEAAAGAFEEVLARVPEDASAGLKAAIFNGSGAAASGMGDSAEAEEFFRRSLEAKDEGNFDARNNLAYIWTRNGVHSAAAMDYARSAVEADPQNPHYLHTLGLVLLTSGEPAEALQLFEKALSMRPSSAPEILENTGDALALLGRQEEAGDYFRRALKSNPEDAALRLKAGLD